MEPKVEQSEGFYQEMPESRGKCYLLYSTKLKYKIVTLKGSGGSTGSSLGSEWQKGVLYV